MYVLLGLSSLDKDEFYEDEPEPLPYTTLSYANGKAFYDHNIPNTEDPEQITRYAHILIHFYVIMK